jgi:hypothetical protein
MRKKQFCRFGFLLAFATCVLCCPQGALAQESNAKPLAHIVEPIITEETMPNEPGDWDLRLTGSYFWHGSARSGFLPRSQLFFGIADRWGGEIEVPFSFSKETTTHYGLGDVSATLKFLARKPAAQSPGLVLGLETTFPTGNTAWGHGEGIYEAAPFVALVQASRHLILQGNLGYSLVRRVRDTDARNQFFYNTALAVPLRHGTTFLLGEINGTHAANRESISFSPGVKFNFTPERYLGLALPIGLNSQTPRMGVVLQLQLALRSAERK